MPHLHIRSAQRDDIELILGFIRELAEYEKLSDQVVASPAQMAEHLFGIRPFAEVLIGELDGAAAGFALFFHNYSTFLGKPGIYLEDLYVRASARGAGLGSALLGKLASLAVERGCARLEWSVLDWNQPSIGFYQNLGAQPLDDWTVYRLTGPALHELSRRTA
ncbi:GNAT family N-acetyltransferase [Pseudomonas sp. sp1636]|uniref:GNAT family N-acetyltransferase n=1 Tax=Pseudomonas sp. sp1636 TaxID=3036707 RepID=UPI0025A5A8A4|nr:GNAT family N-acetyltransferase [Pseudomonas sp. sp1636]MDM8347774.1 GNAT family N-acetyltransferase [Pseudomonas sp. sp1636]